MLRYLADDLEAAMTRDPVAKNRLQVILFYPGFHAMVFYRVAHTFHKMGLFWLPHLLAWFGRLVSGIEIHPGARIGRGLFIDHGFGTVVGETAEIGEDVTIFHGVTLGGRGFDRLGKRHPTIGNGVTLGAGATVLGPITVGDGALVGASAVVLDSVPARATAVGIPARVIEKKASEFADEPAVKCISLDD
ncbi:MAG: serine O-acetyltransferase EpsC [Clostridia bacterium]